MQKRIRARVQRSKYLSLLSGVETREAKPLTGGDDLGAAEHHVPICKTILRNSVLPQFGLHITSRDRFD